MIYSDQNLPRKRRIHSVPNGKSSIVKLRQKILVQVELATQIMVVRLGIVADMGKETISMRKSLFLSDVISSSSKTSTSYGSGADSGDAQKRFSNAKGISSDQFFNKDSDVRSKLVLMRD